MNITLKCSVLLCFDVSMYIFTYLNNYISLLLDALLLGLASIFTQNFNYIGKVLKLAIKQILEIRNKVTTLNMLIALKTSFCFYRLFRKCEDLNWFLISVSIFHRM